MKWITIDTTHINTNNVDCFRWGDGILYIWFVADGLPYKREDPDRELYLKLCQQIGVRPYEEG